MFKATQCHWRRQCFSYHPVIGWWHVPNLTARIPLGETFHAFQSNSIGMRASRDYSEASRPGTKRIIVLGDSYAAGDGVDNDQRFSEIIERAFPNLEVLNFALNGSGTDQQLLIYEHIAKDFHTDAFIFAICVENIARNLCTCRPSMAWNETEIYYRPKPFFEINGETLVLRNVPVPKERRVEDDLADWTCSFPYMKEHPGDAYAIYRYPESQHWQLMSKLLQRFLASVEDKPVLIVPLPMYDHYLESAPPGYLDRFRELEDSARQRWVVDVLPEFLRCPLKERDSYRFTNDSHYTEVAHRAVADALCKSLETRCPGLVA